MSEEIWRPIPGFVGYEASTLGRIRSWRCWNGMPAPRFRKPVMHQGYEHLRLAVGGGVYVTRPVHTLVALAFLGERPPRYDICHNDGNPLNNKPSNLRYDTRTANIRDSQRHGTARYLHGEQMHSAKLTEAQVSEIRKRYASGGCTHRSLAAEYDVSHTVIGRIVRRERWAAHSEGAA